jgi:hypothetical protein
LGIKWGKKGIAFLLSSSAKEGAVRADILFEEGEFQRGDNYLFEVADKAKSLGRVPFSYEKAFGIPNEAGEVAGIPGETLSKRSRSSTSEA